MTSTNDGKDVKSVLISGQKGKKYYIELYRSLDAALNQPQSLPERTEALCDTWGHVHSLCLHSAPSTHQHLLTWVLRHTAQTLLQTEWQSPSSESHRNRLDNALSSFLEESLAAPPDAEWAIQLRQRAEWFKKVLSDPWGHPVLRQLLNQNGEQLTDDELLEWLKEERGIIFETRLRQLATSSCADLALALAAAVLSRARLHAPTVDDAEDGPETTDSPDPPFVATLKKEAGFTAEVWELLGDLELVLHHKQSGNAKCIELAKQIPLRTSYQLVERLRTRLEVSPREKKLWKNAKDVATLVAQVVIARCMVRPVCAHVVRAALFCCTRSLARLLPAARLPPAAAALAAPAATARHLHTLAAAVDQQLGEDMKALVCELYVRAITAGMNEWERLKNIAEKEEEARGAAQTLSLWFKQLGGALGASGRLRRECLLTAFSVHPASPTYSLLADLPPAPPAQAPPYEVKQESTQPNQLPSEFGSWANDSHSITNFVKTSETLNIKRTQQTSNVLSTCVLTEGEMLGLGPELCQDLASLLSGPRVKTLSWELEHSQLLENCRALMERTGGGTRLPHTALRYLHLDPKDYTHLPEEDDGEDDLYYGIEKGYEHLVEIQPEPEEIWAFDYDPYQSETESEAEVTTVRRRKKKPKAPIPVSDEDDPLSLHADKKKERQDKPKKERPHSKERKKKKQPTEDKPKKKSKPKKEILPQVDTTGASLANLIGMKVSSFNTADILDAQKLYKKREDKEKPKTERKKKDKKETSPESNQSQNISVISPVKSEPSVQYDGLFSMEEMMSPKKYSPKLVPNTDKIILSPSERNLCSPNDREFSSPSDKALLSPIERTFTSPNSDVKERIAKLIQFRKQFKETSPNSSQERPPDCVQNYTQMMKSPIKYGYMQNSPSTMQSPCRQSNNERDRKTPITYPSSTEKITSNAYAHGRMTPNVSTPTPTDRTTPAPSTSDKNTPNPFVPPAGVISGMSDLNIAQKTIQSKQIPVIKASASRETEMNKLKLQLPPNVHSVNTAQNFQKIQKMKDFLNDLQVCNNAGSEPKGKLAGKTLLGTHSLNPARKVENAPNTFSRLSYMHKNKMETKNEDKQISQKDLISQELERIIQQNLATKDVSPILSANPHMTALLTRPETTPMRQITQLSEVDQKELTRMLQQKNKLKSKYEYPSSANESVIQNTPQISNFHEAYLRETQPNATPGTSTLNSCLQNSNSIITKDKPAQNPQPDWENVLDTILSHKTPSRGPNALAMTMKKVLPIKQNAKPITSLQQDTTKLNEVITKKLNNVVIEKKKRIKRTTCARIVAYTGRKTIKPPPHDNTVVIFTKPDPKTSATLVDVKTSTNAVLQTQIVPKSTLQTKIKPLNNAKKDVGVKNAKPEVKTSNKVNILKIQNFPASMMRSSVDIKPSKNSLSTKIKPALDPKLDEELDLLDDFIDKELLAEIGELSSDEESKPGSSKTKNMVGMRVKNMTCKQPIIRPAECLNTPKPQTLASTLDIQTPHVIRTVENTNVMLSIPETDSLIFNNNLIYNDQTNLAQVLVPTRPNMLLIRPTVVPEYQTQYVPVNLPVVQNVLYNPPVYGETVNPVIIRNPKAKTVTNSSAKSIIINQGVILPKTPLVKNSSEPQKMIPCEKPIVTQQKQSISVLPLQNTNRASTKPPKTQPDFRNTANTDITEMKLRNVMNRIIDNNCTTDVISLQNELSKEPKHSNGSLLTDNKVKQMLNASEKPPKPEEVIAQKQYETRTPLDTLLHEIMKKKDDQDKKLALLTENAKESKETKENATDDKCRRILLRSSNKVKSSAEITDVTKKTKTRLKAQPKPKSEEDKQNITRKKKTETDATESPTRTSKRVAEKKATIDSPKVDVVIPEKISSIDTVDFEEELIGAKIHKVVNEPDKNTSDDEILELAVDLPGDNDINSEPSSPTITSMFVDEKKTSAPSSPVITSLRDLFADSPEAEEPSKETEQSNITNIEEKSIKTTDILETTQLEPVKAVTDKLLNTEKVFEAIEEKDLTKENEIGAVSVDSSGNILKDDISVTKVEKPIAEEENTIVEDKIATVDSKKTIVEDKMTVVEDKKSIVEGKNINVNHENTIVDDEVIILDDIDTLDTTTTVDTIPEVSQQSVVTELTEKETSLTVEIENAVKDVVNNLLKEVETKTFEDKVSRINVEKNQETASTESNKTIENNDKPKEIITEVNNAENVPDLLMEVTSEVVVVPNTNKLPTEASKPPAANEKVEDSLKLPVATVNLKETRKPAVINEKDAKMNKHILPTSVPKPKATPIPQPTKPLKEDKEITNHVFQEFIRNIKIEGVEILPAKKGQPTKKIVRIKRVSTNSIFKITVYGNVHVDIITLFHNPQIRKIIMNHTNTDEDFYRQKFRLNLNIDRTSGAIDVVNQTVSNVSPKATDSPKRDPHRMLVKETISLLSDEEEEPVVFKTDLGTFKIISIDSEMFDKHKAKLSSMCGIMLTRCPEPKEEIPVIKDSILTDNVDDLVSALVNDILPPTPAPKIIPEVIELDDSSNEATECLLPDLPDILAEVVNATKPTTANPEPKIIELTNQLLSDLGVATSSKPVVIEDLTLDDDEDKVVTKECFVRLDRCDALAEKYRVARTKALELDELKTREVSDSSVADILEDFEVHNVSDTSDDLLDFVEFDVTARCESPSILNIVLEKPNLDGRTSPVIEAFDMIAYLVNKYENNKHSSPVKCNAEWFETKKRPSVVEFQVPTLLKLVIDTFNNLVYKIPNNNSLKRRRDPEWGKVVSGKVTKRNTTENDNHDFQTISDSPKIVEESIITEEIQCLSDPSEIATDIDVNMLDTKDITLKVDEVIESTNKYLETKTDEIVQEEIPVIDEQVTEPSEVLLKYTNELDISLRNNLKVVDNNNVDVQVTSCTETSFGRNEVALNEEDKIEATVKEKSVHETQINDIVPLVTHSTNNLNATETEANHDQIDSTNKVIEQHQELGNEVFENTSKFDESDNKPSETVHTKIIEGIESSNTKILVEEKFEDTNFEEITDLEFQSKDIIKETTYNQPEITKDEITDVVLQTESEKIDTEIDNTSRTEEIYNEVTVLESKLEENESKDQSPGADLGNKTPSAESVQNASTPIPDDEQGIILKGIEYQDPFVGTCYIFHPIVDSSSETDSYRTCLDSPVIGSDCMNESVYQITDDDSISITNISVQSDTQENSQEVNTLGDFEYSLNMSQKTYTRKPLKRKIETYSSKIPKKKYRKSKNIDNTVLLESAYSKEFNLVLNYVDSIEVSITRQYHKELVEVDNAVTNWPIADTCQNEVQIEEGECPLFIEEKCEADTQKDPLKQRLDEELSPHNLDTEYPCSKDGETNLSVGFGEGSGRVIQNFIGGGDSKISAAILSDVKHTQPFVQSEVMVKCDEASSVRRHLAYVKLREKVRSFFEKSRIELSLMDGKKKSDDISSILSRVPGLHNVEFLTPPPLVRLVNVVQVGQLPVSAAAQNPVTCDPRVTQVSDVSPSHCSVDNSPGSDNNQTNLKAEYTELTTADLSFQTLKSQVSETQNESNNENTTTIDVNGDNTDKIATEKETTNSNNQGNNIDYHFDTNNSSYETSNTGFEANTNEPATQENGQDKTDQIAHAMTAAGISEPEVSRPHPLIGLLSKSIHNSSNQSGSENFVQQKQTTSINAMALQQALAQILPPPLNQTVTNENNHEGQSHSQHTPVLHIVQGKNAAGNPITLVDSSQQSVLGQNVLHIVQQNNQGQASNGTPTQNFSGLSLVDTGLQQGGNQLLHIVNTGNQKAANTAGQILKRVNLLTNLANVQGNEQKMVQFVCKSADGKSIHLNAPHQRSMVLRLQPIETPVQSQVQTTVQQQQPPKPVDQTDGSQEQIKSSSIYEENYAKFIQTATPASTPSTEKATSLPKFNQAFGKPVFEEGNQKEEESIQHNDLPMNEDGTLCAPAENPINMEHINQMSSPPLLLRKTTPNTQTPQSIIQQIKNTITPMNIQTMHGGVIYTRQIPVNIGGGQTINLITVPTTELVDESGQKQQTEIEPSIIKIVPQGNSENQEEGSETPAQPQPVLTQMRIKLPMLSKTPQGVPGARVVRPSFFQIQRNVVGGGNQPVYQQLVLTAAPPLGQQTIRLPQAPVRPVKPMSETPSPSESEMSTSTLEQLREFDMVLEQVKERSIQPTTPNAMHTPSTTDSTSNSSQNENLYSIGTNQTVTFVRKPAVTTPVTSTFVRSPDSTAVVDSPSAASIPQTVTEASAENSQPKPKISSKSIKSKPKATTHTPSALKVNHNIPPKTSTQKPLEDEQTTQRILYILAEYKEQVENSPDKDKPAPRRRSNPPANPGGSSKRKKSSGSRRPGCTRDHSPIMGDDACRTMGSEDSSCGTSQGDCSESCNIDAQSPQDSPRKVVRKLTFEPETPVVTQPRPTLPQRNVIVADGQTITVARSTTGKPTTAVLMPANYILPVSMVKGGQQIAIVTNRGPKLLTVGGATGEGGATNALLLQRLIGPAGLKPMLARPGIRHVRLPTAALQNLQAFNLAATPNLAAQTPDSTASPAAAPTPELVETRAASSPWTEEAEAKAETSPKNAEPWILQTSTETHEFKYDEAVTSRPENVDRTVLDAIPDRYSPDMEAQRIFDKMFEVDAKKSFTEGSPRAAGYDIETQDCEDRPYQVVHKKDGSTTGLHRVFSAAQLRHKYAILEHELRLQKSLSEECEDLGVDSPSASDLFPEAELLFAASPAHDHHHDHPHPPPQQQPHLTQHSQPDIEDQIATDTFPQPIHHPTAPMVTLTDGLSDVGIVSVGEDGNATIEIDQEEFARSHPNTTFHQEPPSEDTAVRVQPFAISSNLKPHIASTIFHTTPTVLMTTQPTVISQGAPENVKYSDIDNIINNLPPSNNQDLMSSVLVKDDGLTRYDSILTDSRELHLSNTASAIVHSNATQVIRRVCYEEKRDGFFDEPDNVIAGDDAKMSVAEDNSRDATLQSMDVEDDRSSPERHAELFWESNSASERSESRRPLDFSSDSEKCCKSPSLDDSTDSSGVGTHMRLDSVIKEARGRERSGSADGSSADDSHPPIRTYPPKRNFHSEERSLSGKTRAGERMAHSHEVRRRASGRGVVKRGCHCCNGSPAPPRPKKPRQRKPTLDFSNSN